MAVSKFSKTPKFNVEEVLNNYKNNKCRLCGEIFCCPKCRLKHEGYTHEVHVDCTLCIYGFVILKKLNLPDLVQHVIYSHLLPISRCVFCERHISIDTIRNHNNSNCTFTNFTDKEMTKCWSNLPPEVREEYMNSCNFNNEVEVCNPNIAVSVVVQKGEAELDSPVLGGLQRQQLFENGEFANSTPVLGVENNEDQIKKMDSPYNDQSLILKKLEDKVHGSEDSVKTRKVQFDTTPQPATCKSPASFHGLVKKSSIKKNGITAEALICKTGEASNSNMLTVECDQQPNIHCEHEVQSIEAVNKSLVKDEQSCRTDRVTIPVKPMIRDLNKSAIVENSNETIFDDTDGSHWLTAIGDLAEYNSEHSNSRIMFTTCDMDMTSANFEQEKNLQKQPETLVPLHSMKQETETDVKKDVDVKSTWTDMWTKYKSKVVQFTRMSMKRSRSELEMSSDMEENITHLNEFKRRRLSIRARRPIHYHIKPEVNRDVKKINRGMQTSI